MADRRDVRDDICRIYIKYTIEQFFIGCIRSLDVETNSGKFTKLTN
jgi:hypothetical protein